MDAFVEKCATILVHSKYQLSPIFNELAEFVKANPDIGFHTIERAFRQKSLRIFLFAEDPVCANFMRGKKPLYGKKYLVAGSTKMTRDLACLDFESGCRDYETNLLRLEDAHFGTDNNSLETTIRSFLTGDTPGNMQFAALKFYKAAIQMLLEEKETFDRFSNQSSSTVSFPGYPPLVPRLVSREALLKILGTLQE